MKTKTLLFGIVILMFGGLFHVQAQSLLTNGLVAYYPFNGNANDASGNGNNGSFVGSDRKFLSGRFDQQQSSLFLNTTSTPAWNLDGAYVSAPKSAALDFNNDFTLSVWVNLPSTMTSTLPENFISNGNDAGSINLRMVANHSDFGGQDYLQFIWGDYNNAPYALLAPLRDKWFQVTVVRSGTNVSLFKNGSFLTNHLMSGTANTSTIWLGRHATGGGNGSYYPLVGGIDDVRMYNRALSVSEVQQLYVIESVPPLPYLNLVINLTLLQQATSTDNGLVTTTASPQPLRYATADILKVLAFDENLQGNWPSNSFPKSAQLAIAGESFIVVSGTKILLNVSDIMGFNYGENGIISGAQNDATHLASRTAQKRQIAVITFDDTFVVGGKSLKFYLQGLLSQSKTDTAPVAGSYTETRTATITSAAGEGSSQNVSFVCTGTVTATGKSALSL